jgi:hypothetical protein
MTLGASTASAKIFKMEVNGVFASDADTTSYSAPDTAVHYSYLIDTSDMNTSEFDATSQNVVDISYKLGTGPMISFESFLGFKIDIITLFSAPVGNGEFDQLNINTTVSPLIGSLSDLNFNLGTVAFDSGFYGQLGRFEGEYTLSRVSAPSTVSLLLLTVVAISGVGRRVKK